MVTPGLLESAKNPCRNASSSLSWAFSCAASSRCFLSESCSPWLIASSLSSSLFLARSADDSRCAVAVSASSVAMRWSISLRLKPPRICPTSNPSHHMPPTSSTSPMASAAFQGQPRCVRTAIRGALIEKCRASRRRIAGAGTGGQGRTVVATQPEGFGRGGNSPPAAAPPCRTSPTSQPCIKHALVMKTIVAAALPAASTPGGPDATGTGAARAGRNAQGRLAAALRSWGAGVPAR